MTIDRTLPIGPAGASFPRPAQPPSTAAGGPAFDDVLGLQLSRHAQKRVDRRDIDLDPARLMRLNSAISRAAEKGSRNSLFMLDDLAVVVDVRERTVVTAINAQQGKEKVFTNIDSVVIA